jgi:hypothetical protein
MVMVLVQEIKKKYNSHLKFCLISEPTVQEILRRHRTDEEQERIKFATERLHLGKYHVKENFQICTTHHSQSKHRQSTRNGTREKLPQNHHRKKFVTICGKTETVTNENKPRQTPLGTSR